MAQLPDSDGQLGESDREVFRQRCAAFLEAYGPAQESNVATAKEFLGAAVDAGLGGIVYPTEYGGAGLTKEHDRIWRAEKSKYPAADGEFVISHGMCLPVMNDFGTEEQKRTFMPDMIAGRTMWCQMFSEPGAGSDVASLQTRAVRDGDEWILNGQKVWTTLAHHSDYGIIIARTNPDVPKHAGISMFAIDMRAPGVEIRPIHQIDGGRHFNEVFFTDVRIPVEWLVGEENNGWRQATAMLMYERVAIGGLGSGGGIKQPIYELLADWAKQNGRLTDPVVRDGLMQIYSMETTKAMVSMRTRAEMQAGKAPGPGGSLGKLLGSQIHWRFREIAQSIAGMESIASDGGAGEQLWKHVLNSFQSSIAGGTDEIQRNIIGDRVLGLPREPAVDRDVAFKELKVGTQRTSL